MNDDFDLLNFWAQHHEKIERTLHIPPLLQMVRDGVTGASRLHCWPSFGRERACTLIYREDEVDIYFTMADKPILDGDPECEVSQLFSRQTTIRRTRLPQALRVYSQYRDLVLSHTADRSAGLDGVLFYHSIHRDGEVMDACWWSPTSDRPDDAVPCTIVSAYEDLVSGDDVGLNSWKEAWGQLSKGHWFPLRW